VRRSINSTGIARHPDTTSTKASRSLLELRLGALGASNLFLREP
jgi:hypothetical protein